MAAVSASLAAPGARPAGIARAPQRVVDGRARGGMNRIGTAWCRPQPHTRNGPMADKKKPSKPSKSGATEKKK